MLAIRKSMAFSRTKMSPRIFANLRECLKIRANSRKLADKTNGRKDFEKTMFGSQRVLGLAQCVTNQKVLAKNITTYKRKGGANDKPDRMAALLFLRRAYTIQAAITSTRGMIGYDHTAMTKVHASVVTPESNAMTESPATSSQISSEATVKSCEMIIQTSKPVRLGCISVFITINSPCPILRFKF